MKTLIACLLLAGCQSMPNVYNPQLANVGQRLQMAGAAISADEQRFQPPQIVPMVQPVYQQQPGVALMGHGASLYCARMAVKPAGC